MEQQSSEDFTSLSVQQCCAGGCKSGTHTPLCIVCDLAARSLLFNFTVFTLSHQDAFGECSGSRDVSRPGWLLQSSKAPSSLLGVAGRAWPGGRYAWSGWGTWDRQTFSLPCGCDGGETAHRSEQIASHSHPTCIWRVSRLLGDKERSVYTTIDHTGAHILHMMLTLAAL